jgi:serine/threonine-protein kinase
MVGGTGAAVLIAGTVLGLVAKGTYDDGLTHCPNGPTSCDVHGVTLGTNAHTEAALSTAAFITGGALLAGGAAIYLMAPKANALRIAPTVGAPSGATRMGLDVGGVW